VKKAEVEKLEFGAYKIYWKSGGSSIATIGFHQDGTRWFAPINWLEVPSSNWKAIKKVKLITTGDKKLDKECTSKVAEYDDDAPLSQRYGEAIIKVESTPSDVKLTLINGVDLHISSNRGYFHFSFSGIETQIEVEQVAANNANIRYKSRS
jgi:hypothetical protein